MLATIALLAIGARAKAEEKTAATALQQFEALKKLAGDWVEVGKDGKPTDKLVSSIRVTSAGAQSKKRSFPAAIMRWSLCTFWTATSSYSRITAL